MSSKDCARTVDDTFVTLREIRESSIDTEGAQPRVERAGWTRLYGGTVERWTGPTALTVIAMDVATDLLEEAVRLWERTGLTRPWNDPRADLLRALDGPSSTVLAALDETILHETGRDEIGLDHPGVRDAGCDHATLHETAVDETAPGHSTAGHATAGRSSAGPGLPDADQPSGRGRLIGTVMVGHDGHRGWVYYLAVDPARQGEGIGRALMAAAETWLAQRGIPKVQLMVRATNASVVAFYERLGYDDQECLVLGKFFDDSLAGARAAAH